MKRRTKAQLLELLKAEVAALTKHSYTGNPKQCVFCCDVNPVNPEVADCRKCALVQITGIEVKYEDAQICFDIKLGQYSSLLRTPNEMKTEEIIQWCEYQIERYEQSGKRRKNIPA